MNRIFNLLLITIFILIAVKITFSQNYRTIVSKDAAVMIKVDVTKEPQPSIKLTWLKKNLDYQYHIRRKMINDNVWSLLATLDTNQNSFTDYDVTIGESYEYEVTAFYRAKAHFIIQINNQLVDTTLDAYWAGTGYVLAGIDLPAFTQIKKALLIIDQTVANSIPKTIDEYEQTLITEGWTPIRKIVPRTETFNKDAVLNIKNIIREEYEKSNGEEIYVFLIGRIAVPYSGCIVPDGHTNNHYGAWPCDMYYGSMEEGFWTDLENFTTYPYRDEQKNIKGDGKFDASYSYESINLPIGRVDFYNMPIFTDSAYTEIQLIDKYLQKDIAYRTGSIKFERRGLIDDNFGASSLHNAFASGGWRFFSLFFGADNVKELDWFTTLKTESYLWAYGCGGGSPVSAGGIGNSQQFLTTDVNSIFTVLFGSYFGDWDLKDNFMRSALASGPSVLTCAWSGFPHWYFHHMDMNYPIGYSTRLSQNNWDTYYGSKASLNGQVFYLESQGLQQIHIALMGDPTLTMYVNDVEPAKNLTIIQPKGERVKLSWQPPNETEGILYNIYRSESPKGPYLLLNEEPINETQFIDSNLYEGELYYMVRSVKLQKTNSGTFYNQSRGIIQSFIATEKSEEYTNDLKITINPNPSIISSYVSLQLPLANSVEINIYDIHSKLIKSLINCELNSGTHSIVWDLTDTFNKRVPSGVYFLKVNYGTNIKVYKIVVQ